MANRQLILLRHAKSDWSSGARSDFDRPLNARGRRDAPRVGRWLADNGYTPDCIVASPSARTTETVELALDAMRATLDSSPTESESESEVHLGEVIFESRLYHGMTDDIRAIAAAHLADFERVLVVAHNPGMELALRAYCRSCAPFADGKFMPTCACAVIDLASADAADGALRALTRPSDLP
ncbi:MAG: SixA phosphatase family protein [bacterium]